MIARIKSLLGGLLAFVLAVKVSHIAMLGAMTLTTAGDADAGAQFLLIGAVLMVWERLGAILEELRE